MLISFHLFDCHFLFYMHDSWHLQYLLFLCLTVLIVTGMHHNPRQVYMKTYVVIKLFLILIWHKTHRRDLPKQNVPSIKQRRI